jgi:hypothetical protein
VSIGYFSGDVVSAGNFVNASGTAVTKTIYILATGQSNICGLNDGSGESSVNSKVKAWNGSAWVIMQKGVLPMGCGQVSPGASPFVASVYPNSNNATWHFAKTLQERCGCDVKVVLLGWGGNSISNWVATSSPNYSYIKSTMNALGNPKIDYFIWDQGEADGGMSTSTYRTSFRSVVSQLRSEVWFPANTPIITTGLEKSSGYDIPELTMRAEALIDPFVYFANTDSLTTNVIGGAGVHWDGPSHVVLGSQLYAGAVFNNKYANQVQTLTAPERDTIATQNISWPNVPVLDLCTGDVSDNCGFYTGPTMFHFEGGKWLSNYASSYCPSGQGSCSSFLGYQNTTSVPANNANALTWDQIGGSRLALYDNAGTASVFILGDSTSYFKTSLGIGGVGGAPGTNYFDGSGGARFAQYSNSGAVANLMQSNGVNYINGGNVGIGTTSPLYLLHVGSSAVSGVVARFQNSTGYCDINPTTTSLTCTSDARLKKNVVSIDNLTTLDKLTQLNPVMYNWITEGDASSTHAGFIAQQVQALLPDLVSTDEQGILSVSYAGFVPYIVQSVKVLASKIAEFTNVFHTKTLCVGESGNETCITKSQLDAMLQNANQQSQPTPAPVEPSSTSTDSVTENNSTSTPETTSTSTDPVVENNATTTETNASSTETN